MQSTTWLVIILFLLITYFAYCREKTEQPNAYLQGKPQKNDTERKLYQKIKYCLQSDLKTIKWRRSFLGAIIIVVLLFSIIHQRFPEANELILHVVIIYAVYYAMWHNYTYTISSIAYRLGTRNLARLRFLQRKRDDKRD